MSKKKTSNFVSHSNSTFKQRYALMDGRSRKIVLKELRKQGYRVLEMGISKPKDFENAIASYMKIPEVIRKAPDFLVTKEGQVKLIEVKGTGSQKVVKIKIEDLFWYCFWEKQLGVPCYIAIYDSFRERISLYNHVWQLLIFEVDLFNLKHFERIKREGKEVPKIYIEIPHSHLAWKKLEDA